METGDLLCLYTDGITEATNANDEDYGRSRLIDVLGKTSKLVVIRNLSRVTERCPPLQRKRARG